MNKCSRIMIVEDDVFIAADTKRVLNNAGFEVTDIATSGEQAVIKAKEDNPDLILMDIKLPGSLDGIEAADEIHKTNDVPIVYLTAHSDDSLISRSMDTNPFAYLLKPYNERELQIAVKMALYKYEVDSELIRANTRLEKEVKINIETEQNLRESEERFRQLTENIKDVFWIADKQLKKFIYISPNYDLLWKHDRDTLYNDPKDWLSSVEEEDREALIKDIEDKGLGNFTNEKLPEFRLIQPDGSIRWILARVFPIHDKDGNIYRIAGIAEDISEQKILEENLSNAKIIADEANKTKSEFLANMSHELRTPLNSILGFSQIMEMQQIGNLNEKQYEYITYIKESGNHLLEMINDILDISKIEANKLELHKEPFNLYELLKRLPTTQKYSINEKGLTIESDIDTSIGYLLADEIRIKQVIFNLLSNAIKFTEEGKKIGIKAFGKSNEVTIIVWDEGIGIPEDKIETIFEPFKQIKSIKREIAGTGLGLSISKRIIELHNGNLDAYSRIGKGSSFVITLPGRIEEIENLEIEEDNKEYNTSPIPASTLQNIEVLIVDDNELNLMLVNDCLENYGCITDFAQSGEEAVNKAAQKEYDCILMDIKMDGMSGFEALKIIKGRGYSFPIIAVTANAMLGDREKILNMGFDDYISKPINMVQLLTKIDSVIS